MPVQRTRDAESRVRNKLSNGSLRAQSNGSIPEYSATLQAGVTCRGYIGILLSAQVYPVNQGGTADKIYSSLTETIYSVKGVFLFSENVPDAKRGGKHNEIS